MQGTASVDGEAVNVSKEIKSYEDFAKKLTAEYNLCMLRGFQQPSLFGKVMIGKGNTELMETLIKVACIKALNKKEGQHNFIDDIGNAVVKGYWVGAEMTKIPPIQPATGAWLNIVTTFAPVTFTGTWPTIGNTPPLNDSSTFLDILIAGMRVHLTTISGSYFTISLFPGIPGFISAGVLPYFTYTILPSVTQPVQPVIPQPELPEQKKSVEELLSEIKDDNNTLEAAGLVVASVGSVEFLNDEGQDAGAQIEEIKTKLAPALSPPPPKSDNAQEVDGTNNLEGKEVDCGNQLNYEELFTKDIKLRTLCLDCTFPHKIKEQRGFSVEDLVCNLKAVAENLVQPIKDKYPNVQINSGFRGTPSVPGGVSQHEKGEAIDIQFPGVTPLGYLPITEWIINNCAFDQIIFEHGKSIWLHISYKRTGTNRKKKLTMINGRYENGIKCYYNF